MEHKLWVPEDNAVNSVRPDGHDGFLFPCHEYIAPAGDQEEDARRRRLLSEIAANVDPGHMREFSHPAELVSPGTGPLDAHQMPQGRETHS